jgi:hypothetical protein
VRLPTYRRSRRDTLAPDSLLFDVLVSCSAWFKCAPGEVDPAAVESYITGLTGIDGTTLFTLARYADNKMVLCFALVGVSGWRRVNCSEGLLLQLKDEMSILPGLVDTKEGNEYDK